MLSPGLGSEMSRRDFITLVGPRRLRGPLRRERKNPTGCVASACLRIFSQSDLEAQSMAGGVTQRAARTGVRWTAKTCNIGPSCGPQVTPNVLRSSPNDLVALQPEVDLLRIRHPQSVIALRKATQYDPRSSFVHGLRSGRHADLLQNLAHARGQRHRA